MHEKESVTEIKRSLLSTQRNTDILSSLGGGLDFLISVLRLQCPVRIVPNLSLLRDDLSSFFNKSKGTRFTASVSRRSCCQMTRVKITRQFSAQQLELASSVSFLVYFSCSRFGLHGKHDGERKREEKTKAKKLRRL